MGLQTRMEDLEVNQMALEMVLEKDLEMALEKDLVKTLEMVLEKDLEMALEKDLEMALEKDLEVALEAAVKEDLEKGLEMVLEKALKMALVKIPEAALVTNPKIKNVQMARDSLIDTTNAFLNATKKTRSLARRRRAALKKRHLRKFQLRSANLIRDGVTVARNASESALIIQRKSGRRRITSASAQRPSIRSSRIHVQRVRDGASVATNVSRNAKRVKLGLSKTRNVKTTIL
jgi:hypothetical protein